MQFTIILASLISLTSAAAVTKRFLATFVACAGVCGGISTPVCCQLDVLGVANLNGENPGAVATTEEFVALCAETGTSAQCCALPVGADALLCTGA